MFVVDRTHDCQFFGVFGQQREVFTEMDSRCSSLDMLKFAADFSGCVWFGIERLIVTHATPGIDNDAELGFTLRGSGTGRCPKKSG